MSQQVLGLKRGNSSDSSPSNSKRLRVDQSTETITSKRDQKKRKKRRKKAPVVSTLQGAHRTHDSSSQLQQPPASVLNKIIRFASPDLTAKNASQNANLQLPNLTPIISLQHHEDRITQLTKELAQREELLAAHQRVFTNISQALTCQICLDVMYKPYALAPCGHIACYDCLVQWFNAPPADNRPAPPTIVRKKTCPHCRAVVRDRPTEIWVIKNLVHVIGKTGFTDVHLHNKAQVNADRRVDADPWDNIFRKSVHSHLPWFLTDDADVEPRRGEDVGMLDIEDGGIYRCLDCMHEIWDGLCSACGRRYPGHEGGGWPDDELGLDFTPGAEVFDPDDDPGWMGLEDGDGDDEDGGSAIADWYPGLPLFRWHFGFDDSEGEEEEGDDDDDDDDDGDEDASYDSSFIDDTNNSGSPQDPLQEMPQIYELADDSDNDDNRLHVDVNIPSEEKEENELSLNSSWSRRAALVVSSGEEDEDEFDGDFAVLHRTSRASRQRLVESDDEIDVVWQ